MELLDMDIDVRMPDHFEIVRGEIIALPPTGDIHGLVEMRVGFVLNSEGDNKGLGFTFGGEVGVVVVAAPQTVRGADGAFILKSQLPIRKTREGYLLTPPALVVEVLSPGDRASEVQAKIREYLAAGVKLVWVVDPANLCVTVHHPDGTSRVLAGDHVLSAPGVLDAMTTTVSALFRGLDSLYSPMEQPDQG